MAKCRCCSKEIDVKNAYKVGKCAYYCDFACYDQKMTERELLKKKYKPRENTDRRDFTDYVQKIYLDNGYDKSEINWTLIMANAKNILESHEVWSYSTLQYILYYMYEIAEVNLFSEESNTILGLLPFYGMEAEAYYNETKQLEENVSNFNFDNTTIKIKKGNSINNKKYRPIDLTNL